MSREVISTRSAPAAIGPYSQAVDSDGLVFLSGQVPVDPATGILEEGGIEKQTARVMENLKAVLAAADLTFDNVVKSTIYLVDLGDFSAVNDIYGNFFENAPPARATVQVAALPLGASVEIDMIAAR